MPITLDNLIFIDRIYTGAENQYLSGVVVDSKKSPWELPLPIEGRISGSDQSIRLLEPPTLLAIRSDRCGTHIKTNLGGRAVHSERDEILRRVENRFDFTLTPGLSPSELPCYFCPRITRSFDRRDMRLKFRSETIAAIPAFAKEMERRDSQKAKLHGFLSQRGLPSLPSYEQNNSTESATAAPIAVGLCLSVIAKDNRTSTAGVLKIKSKVGSLIFDATFYAIPEQKCTESISSISCVSDKPIIDNSSDIEIASVLKVFG